MWRLWERAAPYGSVPILWIFHSLMWIYCFSTTTGTKNGPNSFTDCLCNGLLHYNIIALRCCGEMSKFKMQTPLGRGYVRNTFPKTATTDCILRFPIHYFFMPVFLLVFSLVTPAYAIHVESIESHSEFTCEPIRLRMCQDLPYNTTFMPNLLNHYDQQTAALAMEVCLYMCVSVCESPSFVSQYTGKLVSWCSKLEIWDYMILFFWGGLLFFGIDCPNM